MKKSALGLLISALTTPPGKTAQRETGLCSCRLVYLLATGRQEMSPRGALPTTKN